MFENIQFQYNSSQNYFLQATTWKRPFKKTPISSLCIIFGLYTVVEKIKTIQEKLGKSSADKGVRNIPIKELSDEWMNDDFVVIENEENNFDYYCIELYYSQTRSLK